MESGISELNVGIGLTSDTSEIIKLDNKLKENIFMIGTGIYHNNKKVENVPEKQKIGDRLKTCHLFLILG